MVPRIKKILTGAVMFITAFGLIGFSLFIFEESFQCAQFGTWQAINAQNWELVLEGADIMSGINLTMKVVNYSIGWINPLSFLSYRAYGASADYYVKSLKSRIFAHQPELFVGRQVKFTFTPKEIRQESDHVRLISGHLHVLTRQSPKGPTLSVQGRLQQVDHLLVVDMTNP